ncbi:hypothetical protein [Nocardioides houyundeii]|uniref:hypothetical protein n=1 Tax=Nocardioides houyundeii TaxID=2045452 RepID=UPI000DF433CC|nr:hypothetical protein [Nocardioides houyundeii]
MIHPLRATIPLLLCLALMGAAAGCTGSGTDGDAGAPAASEATTEPSVAVPARATKVLMGQVVGPIPGARLRALRHQVTPVIDEWLDTAFVGGEWPRTVTGAFAGFTPAAARAARRDRRLVSGADLAARIDSVQVTKRAVRYDVLAVGRRPVGVTARITLDYRTDGEVRTKVLLRGRVSLTKVGDDWKVFAYDLTKGRR